MASAGAIELTGPANYAGKDHTHLRSPHVRLATSFTTTGKFDQNPTYGDVDGFLPRRDRRCKPSEDDESELAHLTFFCGKGNLLEALAPSSNCAARPPPAAPFA